MGSGPGQCAFSCPHQTPVDDEGLEPSVLPRSACGFTGSRIQMSPFSVLLVAGAVASPAFVVVACGAGGCEYLPQISPSLFFVGAERIELPVPTVSWWCVNHCAKRPLISMFLFPRRCGTPATRHHSILVRFPRRCCTAAVSAGDQDQVPGQ